MALLYDQFGREIQVQKQPETREIAVTTLRDRWSSYPSEGLTPQRLASIFKEADGGSVYRQAELFEEMEEKDTHLFSELQTRKNAVLGLDYDITAYSDSAEDKKIRDFVADCIFNLSSFEDGLLDLLDAVGKGYSMLEMMWGIEGNSAKIKSLQWIHAKNAVYYDLSGNMWQRSYEAPKIITEVEPINGEQMPPWKLVYHRYKARSGYDTRAGILRVCAWMYLFKNYDLKDWVAFAEVFGMPLRIGKYDSGATKADKDALLAAIRSLASDAAGIISKNTEIEFVEAMKQSGGGSSGIYEGLANFCNKEMSKAILGQTATTEGTPGKLGNEGAQDKVRHDLTESDAEALSKTVRFQIIRPLVGYNFGWDKPLPWFKLMYEPAEDLQALSETYKNIHTINFPLSAAHVSEKFKIPLPKEGEEVLPGPAPAFSFPSVNSLPARTEGRRSGDLLPGLTTHPRGRKANTGDLSAIAEAVRLVLASSGSDPSMEAEIKIEKERLKFVDRYTGAIMAAELVLREKAMKDVVALLAEGGNLGEKEFIDQVYGIIDKAYQGFDKAAILRPLKDCYKFYRTADKSAWSGETSPVKFVWNTRDDATLSFLEKIDRFYLSKYIRNDDIKGPVWSFLKEKYLENGDGLFGRTNMNTIDGFRDLFDDKLAELSDAQIQRICDTSVARMRNFANVEQLREAGVQYATVVAVLDDRTSAICQAMNGQRIPVARLYETVVKETSMNPGEYSEYVKKRITVATAEAGSAMPPYHPNCRTRLVMALED